MVDDRNIGITVNPISHDECYVTMLNYSDKTIKPEAKIKEGWEINPNANITME